MGAVGGLLRELAEGRAELIPQPLSLSDEVVSVERLPGVVS